MVAQCTNDMAAPCIAEGSLSCFNKYLRGNNKIFEGKLNEYA